ncbi:hypothetical protein GVN16_13910 [Emticicia sp. CRIBPO]|uniref:hypothetical protein n=1 Tax=Emticicia sp. CRIBPO TaxID=2683258 RepID=UPI001412B809|nr:hypothetical protein [Emticicia sp. CRIBPO]NBA86865.1 hypothetical protein [Emticicia sp. CRIBPO]
MKTNVFFAFLLLLFVVFSCKTDIVDLPGTGTPPQDTTSQRSFRIVFENMTGYRDVPNNLTAVLAVESAKGTVVNLSAAVVFDRQYTTAVVKLPKGSFVIRKLVITDGEEVARFATPVAGSPKALMVTKPLSIALTLDENTLKEVRLEVLPVAVSDAASGFGYPEGTFGKPQTDPDSDKQIFVHPVIRIGEVVYDSIPTQLVVRSWDVKNEMTYHAYSLAGGKQAVSLSGKAVKHQLSILTWGIKDEFTLAKGQIKENMVYTMGGERPAKKLKTVFETKVVNTTSSPLTKTSYEYHPNGQLKQKQVLGKRPDMSNYVVQKDVYEYTNNKITGILSYDENSRLVKTMSAQYNAEGKLTGMEEKKGALLTRAVVHYFPLETWSGHQQDYRADVVYTYEHGDYTGYYSKTMHAGGVLADKFSRHGNLEEGLYNYDRLINPYVHLGIPDLFLNHLPKHNMAVQWKTWTGAHPEIIAYDFKYTYDAEGYPKELLTKYRSYTTKADVYTIRTTFEY